MTHRHRLTTLIAILVINGGCSFLIHLSSSSFLSNFSLEDLVKENRSPSGMACAKGGMGGGGGDISSIGRHTSNYKSSSFSCQIDPAFDEADFMASLKTDVEKEIKGSGANVIDQGSSDPAEFYFEYREGAVRGRINISGKKGGANYYSLQASIDEKR